MSELPTLKNKLVWHKVDKELLTVKEDYENGELLFSNNVLGRDEDVIPTDLIQKFIQQNSYLLDEFINLIKDDDKFNYDEDEFIDWLFDCVLTEEEV